jgi:hypothetical protein
MDPRDMSLTPGHVAQNVPDWVGVSGDTGAVGPAAPRRTSLKSYLSNLAALENDRNRRGDSDYFKNWQSGTRTSASAAGSASSWGLPSASSASLDLHSTPSSAGPAVLRASSPVNVSEEDDFTSSAAMDKFKEDNPEFFLSEEDSFAAITTLVNSLEKNQLFNASEQDGLTSIAAMGKSVEKNQDVSAPEDDGYGGLGPIVKFLQDNRDLNS